MDIFSGTTFSVPKPQTRGLSVDSFMKAMGATQNNDIDFEPIEPPSGQVMQPGTDMTDSYYNQIGQLNSFAMKMAAKGIDILNPKTPEEGRAASIFQQQMGQVRREANALVAGQKLTELHIKEKLKEGVVGPKLDPSKVTTAEDFNELVNSNPFNKALNNFVTATNTAFAKSYDSEAERDEAKQAINERRKQVADMLPKAIEMGIPEEFANVMIQNAINSLGEPTADPTASRTNDLREMRIKSQNAVDRARIRNLDADTKKDLADNSNAVALERKKLIQNIRSGDYDSVRAIVGGTHGGKKVADAEYVSWDERKGSTGIKVKYSDGSTGFIPFKPGSTGEKELNNVLNSVLGKHKDGFVTDEELLMDNSSMEYEDVPTTGRNNPLFKGSAQKGGGGESKKGGFSIFE